MKNGEGIIDYAGLTPLILLLIILLMLIINFLISKVQKIPFENISKLLSNNIPADDLIQFSLVTCGTKISFIRKLIFEFLMIVLLGGLIFYNRKNGVRAVGTIGLMGIGIFYIAKSVSQIGLPKEKIYSYRRGYLCLTKNDQLIFVPIKTKILSPFLKPKAPTPVRNSKELIVSLDSITNISNKQNNKLILNFSGVKFNVVGEKYWSKNLTDLINKIKTAAPGYNKGNDGQKLLDNNGTKVASDDEKKDTQKEGSFLQGNLVFINAAKEGKKDKIESLIKAGVDVNAQDKEGDTALIWASHKGHKEIVLLLIDNGADINIKNKYGNTALQSATSGKHEEIIELLDKIKITAPDYKKGNEDGKSPTSKINFKCPSCYKDVKTNSNFAGKKGNCPKCGKTIVIPLILRRDRQL